MSSSDQLRDRAIDRFWETVPPVWNLVRSRIRATATVSFDISVEQFHILRFVRKGTGSLTELAEAKNISRPAMSQAVEVLVKKGLLTRVQSAQDRRYVQLDLTEAGKSLLESVFRENRRWMKERMRGMSAEDLQVMMKAMEVMKKMLE